MSTFLNITYYMWSNVKDTKQHIAQSYTLQSTLYLQHQFKSNSIIISNCNISNIIYKLEQISGLSQLHKSYGRMISPTGGSCTKLKGDPQQEKQITDAIGCSTLIGSRWARPALLLDVAVIFPFAHYGDLTRLCNEIKFLLNFISVRLGRCRVATYSEQNRGPRKHFDTPLCAKWTNHTTTDRNLNTASK